MGLPRKPSPVITSIYGRRFKLVFLLRYDVGRWQSSLPKILLGLSSVKVGLSQYIATLIAAPPSTITRMASTTRIDAFVGRDAWDNSIHCGPCQLDQGALVVVHSQLIINQIKHSAKAAVVFTRSSTCWGGCFRRTCKGGVRGDTWPIFGHDWMRDWLWDWHNGNIWCCPKTLKLSDDTDM
jgi:hypothetical protein